MSGFTIVVGADAQIQTIGDPDSGDSVVRYAVYSGRDRIAVTFERPTSILHFDAVTSGAFIETMLRARESAVMATGAPDPLRGLCEPGNA